MSPAEKAALKIKYQNRMSLPPAERAAVEAAYEQLLAEESARWSGEKPAATTPEPADYPDNVESAATPIAPDPMVGRPRDWRDLSDAEMLEPLADEAGGGVGVTRGDLPAYGQRYQQAVHNEIDRGVARRQDARRSGYQDPEQVAYNEATGLPAAQQSAAPNASALPPAPVGRPVQMIGGKPFVNIDGAIYPADSPMVSDLEPYAPTDYGHGTMMVDGVEVGIVRPADPLLNQPAQYRLADVEKERQRRAQWEGSNARRQSSMEENRTYGSPYVPPSEWSDTQAKARETRAMNQVMRSNAGREHQRRIRRISEEYGVPLNVAQEAYMEAMNSIDSASGPDRTKVPAGPVAGDKRRGMPYADGALTVGEGILTPAGIGYVMHTAAQNAIAKGGRDIRAERQQYARDAVVRRAQAQRNPLEYLQNPTVNDWGQFVMASHLLGSPQGPTPLGVDAVGGQNALRMLQGMNLAQGMGNNPLLGVQAAVAQQQLDQSKPVQVRAAERVKAGDIRHPDVRQHAMDIMHNSYSSAHPFGSSFTDNEVELAAQRMAVDTGMDIGDARTLMKELQADRNSGLWSGISGVLFDQ